jgi:hypothetical protein
MCECFSGNVFRKVKMKRNISFLIRKKCIQKTQNDKYYERGGVDLLKAYLFGKY